MKTEGTKIKETQALERGIAMIRLVVFQRVRQVEVSKLFSITNSSVRQRIESAWRVLRLGMVRTFTIEQIQDCMLLVGIQYDQDKSKGDNASALYSAVLPVDFREQPDRYRAYFEYLVRAYFSNRFNVLMQDDQSEYYPEYTDVKMLVQLNALKESKEMLDSISTM